MTALQCHNDFIYRMPGWSDENNGIVPQFYSFSATLVHSLDNMNATLVILIDFHTSIIYDLMNVHCNQEKKTMFKKTMNLFIE